MSTAHSLTNGSPPSKLATGAVRQLLTAIGEDPEREGLQRTPQRVAKALDFLTSGCSVRPADILNDAIFQEDGEGLVLVREIEFYSLCEHHMLPFHGSAHIAYMPAGRVIGLSKLPRLLEIYSRRLQVQERLTRQVAAALEELLEPRGVAVMVDAAHFCMMMRGVQKQMSRTTTTTFLGEFRESASLRAEFLASVGASPAASLAPLTPDHRDGPPRAQVFEFGRERRRPDLHEI